jgi:hypothetical protein
MNHPQAVVSMAAHLIQEGLTTREASIQIKEVYSIEVSHVTISRWAGKAGLKFNDTRRYKPCRLCGTSTKHLSTCPVTKNLGPKANPLDVYQAFVVG